MSQNQQNNDQFKHLIRKKIIKGETPATSQEDDLLWAKIEAQETEKNPVRQLYPLLRYAALILVLFSVGAVGLFLLREEKPVSDSLVPNKKEKPANDNEGGGVTEGENLIVEEAKQIQGKVAKPTQIIEVVSGSSKKNFVLPDASEFVVNQNSRLNYFYDDERRQITLEDGEAYFDVESNSQKPFYVKAGDYEVKVVGTKFNIRRKKYIEVTVLEGAVLLYPINNPKASVRITKGMQALTLSTGEIAIDSVIAQNFIAWDTKSLSFSYRNLAEVLEMVERTYNIKIDSEESLKNCTFTGDLSGFSAEEALNIISLTHSLKLETRNDQYHLSGSCE